MTVDPPTINISRRNILAHRLLIDINVILDVAGEREPYREPSQKILSMIERRKAHGFVSAVSYSTLYYLLQRDIGHGDAREFLTVLSELVSIVPVDKSVIERAMRVETVDYEDAIQIASAEACRADFIVTRDVHGYKKSSVKPITPSEYLATY